MRRLWPIPLLLALSVFATRPAHAQHADANFEAGLSKRFLSGGLKGSVGPIIGLSGDLALMPLIRVGAYFDEELAADGEAKAPFITSFGGRVKFLPPLGSEKLRAWLFVGIGYAIVSAPGYHTSEPVPNFNTGGQSNVDATVASTGGSFVEIPFGIGGSYQLRAPWVVLAELSGRASLGSGGNYFDPTGRPATITSTGDSIGIITGSESFAVILTVGIGLDL